MILHELELDWISRLQSIFRSPSMDVFFIGFSYVDSFSFFIILLGIVWFLIEKRAGIFLFYVYLLSSVINPLLKNHFNLPRPVHLNPELGILNLSSPGFPSGAAQTAAILAGMIFIMCKKPIYRCMGLIFAFLLCFSRVYLGLHFFSDIVGGLIVGSCLVVTYWKFSPWIEKNQIKFAFFFPALLLLIFQSKFLIQSGLSLGIAVGLFSTTKKSYETKSSWMPYLEALFSILGMFLFFEVKDSYPNWKFFFAFAGGFWFSFLGPFLVRRIQIILSTTIKNRKIDNSIH